MCSAQVQHTDKDNVARAIAERSSRHNRSKPRRSDEIVDTTAKPGDMATKGQPVVVLEAMKMEHALVAPFDGVVGEISVAVGDQVAADTVLATVTAGD